MPGYVYSYKRQARGLTLIWIYLFRFMYHEYYYCTTGNHKQPGSIYFLIGCSTAGQSTLLVLSVGIILGMISFCSFWGIRQVHHDHLVVSARLGSQEETYS